MGLFGLGSPGFTTTDEYHRAINAANNPGWQQASGQQWQSNAGAYKFDPNLASQIQGIVGQQANFNYNPQQVGGGQVASDMDLSRNAYLGQIGQAYGYANAPLTSALAQRQGIADSLAAQRSLAISGPMQFNQALAQRNAARYGSDLYGSAIAKGQIAQRDEALLRQKALLDALNSGGTGLSNVAATGLAGQHYNQQAGVEAANLGITSRNNAAAAAQSLGQSGLDAAIKQQLLEQQEAAQRRQSLSDYFANQATAANNRLATGTSYRTGSQANVTGLVGQAIGGATKGLGDAGAALFAAAA